MFGRKRLFVTAMAGFTLAMLVAGFAQNAIYLDTFSGILGLFSAAAIPPAVGALGAVYDKPSKRKDRAFACFSAGNPLGYVGGMIVSGVASYAYNWRASFWTLAVIYSIFTGLTVWTVPADGSGRMPFTREAFKKFDLPGIALIITGFSFFSSSLTCVSSLLLLKLLMSRLAGDAPNCWRTSYVLALLIIGIILLGCFIYWQSRATYPLMPLYVWRDRNFSLVRLSTCQSAKLTTIS